MVSNPKRVYRVIRDHNFLLNRQRDEPMDTRKHEGLVAVKAGKTRRCSDGFELASIERRFGAGNTPEKQIEWRTYISSCFTARDIRKFAKAIGLKPITTPVESPQSNGMAESFVKTFKRDCARLCRRLGSQTIMRDLKRWFDHSNDEHPHSALGYLPPRRFREKQRSIK